MWKYWSLFLVSCICFSQNNTPLYQFSEHITFKIEKDSSPWAHQLGSYDYANNGYHKKALYTWFTSRNTMMRTTEAHLQLWGNMKAVNAKEYIVSKAREHDIVIINEAHYNARHRNFVRSLLEDLYADGYRNFGLEAVHNEDLNELKFPTQQTGYYTKEPEFGLLLYEAISLGFKVFKYEADENLNNKEREFAQATNIANFLQENPTGKTLILCGHQHVTEIPMSDWGKAMAGHVKEITGKDPLTINQEMLSDTGEAHRNHDYINRLKSDESWVLVDKTSMIPFRGFQQPERTDLVIIHSSETEIDNVPVWQTEGRKRIVIPISKLTNWVPNLLLVYRAGEELKEGVPVVVSEWLDPQDKIIYVPNGNYIIQFLDKNYTLLKKEPLNVQ